MGIGFSDQQNLHNLQVQIYDDIPIPFYWAKKKKRQILKRIKRESSASPRTFSTVQLKPEQ